MLTGNNTNAFVRDGKLIIKPTLLDDDLITRDSTVNMTADGTCTSNIVSDCAITSNITAHRIIPPVLSARISTKQSVSITYGRVEVEAKFAAGDWLLSAIYMNPLNNTYGSWPKSGEIDIAMCRGNKYTYIAGGNNILSSTLHWGLSAAIDGWRHTSRNATALHSTYAAKYHTLALEWSKNYLFTYVDSRLMEVMYTGFKQSLWSQGDFPVVDDNNDKVANPWADSPNKNAPFDQPFYLTLEVSVGGTSGWFVDGIDGKPWVDETDTAAYDFWSARDQWLPTWEAENAGQMEVQRVRMWQQCD